MSSDIFQNPKRKWKYTWESQSHTPTLRLLIFNSETNPKLECQDLQIKLLSQESSVSVTWVGQNDGLISIRVPIPSRVLLDADAPPLTVKAAEDHVEVKLVLLLPVDHPIVLNFNEGDETLQPPAMDDSDISALSSEKDVNFYCRNCSSKLTINPISCFVEMPSTDWRESADNWFGGCCCSFGGVSEKLVAGYANSYSSVMGKCLVSSTSVVVCKDDLLGDLVPAGENKGKDEYDNVNINLERNHETPYKVDLDSEGFRHLNGEFSSLRLADKMTSVEQTVDDLLSKRPLMNGHENFPQLQPCSGSKHTVDPHTAEENHSDCLCITHQGSLEGEELNENFTSDQKFLLDGLLENIFMIRSSHLSKNVEWNEVLCPNCSVLLGAYPSSVNCNGPLDGGIRFFKCCISTCSEDHHPSNILRNYTLERMFSNQLLESAKDELMFRTLVRDLKSKTPVLQLVMLNPNSWSCSSFCSDTQEPVSSIELRPVMKVLFSHSSDFTRFQTSPMSNWVKNSDADEVHMLKEQIDELIHLLQEGNTSFPSSCAYLQGLPLSSLHR